MTNLSRRMNKLLETECGHTLDELLERHSRQDFEQILDAAASAETTGRTLDNAIALLGRWGDEAAVPVIAERIDDLDARSLMNAIDALSHLGGTAATRTIARYAKHDSPDVRRFVVIGLERIGTKTALDRVARIARSDDVGFVRSRARRALRAQRHAAAE